MTEYVTTAAGGRIAYDRYGSGPAVILVGGAMQFRAFDPQTGELAQALAARGLTVLNYDRLGRGETEAAEPPTLDGEIAALRALVEVAGGSAALYGSSSGGAISLAAAAAGVPVTRLALWEVPLDQELGSEGTEFLADLRAALDAGDPEGALEFFMRDMPKDWVESSRNSPAWPVMISIAPSLAPDSEAVAWTQSRPRRELWADVRVPVLVLLGEQTSPNFATAADSLVSSLSDAQTLRVPGAWHRWELDPMVDVLADFFRS